MDNKDDATWYPQRYHIEDAQVTALAKRLNLPDYDSLHAYSLEHPDKYWKVALEFLGIRWSRVPEGYVDLSRGVEFPDWFPGGELNWVDTVLAWGEDPRTRDRRGVVAEHEDGSCETLSFAELGEMVRRFAAGLRERGVKRGDRIGLLCENGIEASVSVLAISYLGAIVVPLFSGFGADAIVSRLESSGARGLIATTGFPRRARSVDMVAPAQEALKRLPAIDLVIWKQGKDSPAPAGALTWREVAATPHSGDAPEGMLPNDPFMVIYTSGTTGNPKGIVHTHAGFPIKTAHDAAMNWNIDRGDVFCWTVDMGWIAGPIALCAAMMRGASLICYAGAPDYPDWSRMSRLIERHGVTHFGAAPTLIRGIAANESVALQGDKSSVKVLFTAGEGIDPAHFTWFRKNFATTDCPLINSSGGTEVSCLLLGSVVVKPISAGSFNTTSPAVAVSVIDPSGNTLIDEVGELAIRAPFVGMTRSFWQDDERYLETYWRTVPGVWVHGDLVIQTSNNGFFILGRSDDTLKIAGKRVGPAEVEQILLEMDAVQEVAAVGAGDPFKGEKLIVFIVLVPGYGSDREALARTMIDRIGEQLGKPFRPSNIYFVEQLPKTRTSKIMRRLIKSVCNDRPLGDLSSLDNPTSLNEIRSAISV